MVYLDSAQMRAVKSEPDRRVKWYSGRPSRPYLDCSGPAITSLSADGYGNWSSLQLEISLISQITSLLLQNHHKYHFCMKEKTGYEWMD